MAVRDAVVAAVLLGLAAAAIVESGRLPFGTVRNPGEGFFPWWLGVALAVLAVVLLARALRGHGARRTGEAGARVGRVVTLLAALGAYSLALEPVGYPLSTFLLVLLTLAPSVRREVLPAVGFAAAVAGASYVLFAVWLEVPLPPGPLGR